MSSSQYHTFPNLLASGQDFFYHDIVSSTISHFSWSDTSSTQRFPQFATLPELLPGEENSTSNVANGSIIAKSNAISQSNLASSISGVARAFFAYLVPVGVLLSLFNNASTVVVLRRRRLVRAMSKTVCDKRPLYTKVNSLTWLNYFITIARKLSLQCSRSE